MNERIKELAEQCWDERPEGQLHFDSEKFAELIVRECVGVNYKSPFRDGEFHAREVLDHFGVEE